jgi:hypothetical protein
LTAKQRAKDERRRRGCEAEEGRLQFLRGQTVRPS